MSATTLPIEIVRQILQYSTPLELYHLGPVAGLTKDDILNAITNDKSLLELVNEISIGDQWLFDHIIRQKTNLLHSCLDQTSNKTFIKRYLDLCVEDSVNKHDLITCIVERIIKTDDGNLYMHFDKLTTYKEGDMGKLVDKIDYKLISMIHDYITHPVLHNMYDNGKNQSRPEYPCFNLTLCHVYNRWYCSIPQQYYYPYIKKFALLDHVGYTKLLLHNECARHYYFSQLSLSDNYDWISHRFGFINNVSNDEIKTLLQQTIDDIKNNTYTHENIIYKDDAEGHDDWILRTCIKLPFDF